ncbi:HPP family protein [Streptomyces lavendulae]|uniref:Inosine 5'-monophosphate dehydrogenase n=1 Tax=Streptomyces lavendulae subsp. lavendulae TaxID=58340 RepID=A0A2K8P997_STRLA|nr:CBS domain-containing protein [Streptomyces lavendulae]ATZ23296.1 inosine 5'-monophosphate dehydrogenase [Streptomyces lavendulae subsp. lavendulae]QUQ53127.1 hypothetical protein SLLC_04970 [Streptomyces lavendulae subsp. lavendulae]
MKHIKVADLMTDEVVSVAPGTAFKDVAKLLAQYDISGVPVLDDEDRVVGVVSQTDLPAHAGPGPGTSLQNGTAVEPPTAGDVMSAQPLTRTRPGTQCRGDGHRTARREPQPWNTT